MQIRARLVILLGITLFYFKYAGKEYCVTQLRIYYEGTQHNNILLKCMIENFKIITTLEKIMNLYFVLYFRIRDKVCLREF